MTCHEISHFNSGSFILDFNAAELLIRNFTNQVAELFQRARTMKEIIYFSEDLQFFDQSPFIKIRYDWISKCSHLLTGEASFETGKILSAKLSTGEATGDT